MWPRNPINAWKWWLQIHAKSKPSHHTNSQSFSSGTAEYSRVLLRIDMLRQRLYAAGQDTVCKKSKCDILTRHVPQDEAVRTTGQKAIEISSLLSPPPRSPHLHSLYLLALLSHLLSWTLRPCTCGQREYDVHAQHRRINCIMLVGSLSSLPFLSFLYSLIFFFVVLSLSFLVTYLFSSHFLTHFLLSLHIFPLLPIFMSCGL